MFYQQRKGSKEVHVSDFSLFTTLKSNNSMRIKRLFINYQSKGLSVRLFKYNVLKPHPINIRPSKALPKPLAKKNILIDYLLQQ